MDIVMMLLALLKFIVWTRHLHSRSPVQPTERPMTVRKEYRIGGTDDYVIDCVPQANGTYEIYARLHPPDRHGKGMHHHHLMSGGHICVAAGKKPKSAAAAVQIGRCWAEGFSQYRRTGKYPGS